MRKIIIKLHAQLFTMWLRDTHKINHPVEWLLHHGYLACGLLVNAMRPR